MVSMEPATKRPRLSTLPSLIRLLLLAGLGIEDELDIAGLEIEEVEAAGERQNGAIPSLRSAMEPIFCGTIPGADLAPVGRAAEDVAPETVDPIEALLLHIPERAFAQDRLHVDQNFDAHGFLPVPVVSVSRRSAAPACRARPGRRRRRARPPPAPAVARP